MIYLFLGIPRQSYNLNDRVTLRVRAENRTAARAQLARDYVLFPAGQINDSITAKKADELPACLKDGNPSIQPVLNRCDIATVEPEQNHSLSNAESVGNIAPVEATNLNTTTTNDGNRSRHTRGIFLPQIYLSSGVHCPKSIEFAVQMTSGNKASNRTNNAGRSFAEVESVSHPITGDTNQLLTKQTRNSIMKNPISYTARRVSICRTPSLASRIEGVIYA